MPSSQIKNCCSTRLFFQAFVIGLLLSVAGTQCQGQKPESHPLLELETPPLDAQPEQYVLCASRRHFDEAISEGTENSVVIYYSAKVVKVGESESSLQSLSGRKFSLPNQLIVPIPEEQTAKVGDIVLTWWQSGSGLQRAIVVGGSPEQPVVRYLDLDYSESGAASEDVTLMPNSFVVLTAPWQPGTTVAIGTESKSRHGTLLGVFGDKILVSEYGSKLRVRERAHAKPIAMTPELTEGDVVQGVVFGQFQPVNVKRVDSRIGRVFVSYQFGSGTQEAVLSFGEVFKE